MFLDTSSPNSEITYGTNDEDCQSQADGGNTYSSGAPAGWEIDTIAYGVDPATGWPGNLGSFLNVDQMTFGNTVADVLPGAICAPDTSLTNTTEIVVTEAVYDGLVVCNGTGITKISDSNQGSLADPFEITIISHGPIDISGQNLYLAPAVNGVLAWTDQRFSDSAVSIKGAGSDINVVSRAILFTPRSGQDVSGSNDATLCIQMIGQGSLKVAGSNSTFGPLGPNCVSEETGSLELAKSLSGGPGGYDGPFTIDYDCDGTEYDGSESVTAGSSETVPGIPTGTWCTISETPPTPPAGYSFGTPTYTESSGDTDDDGIVVIGNGTTVTVTTNNTLALALETGSLEITKTVDKGTSSFTSGTFTVHVVCTDDPNSPYDEAIAYPSPGSVTIDGIPVGSECTVTETGKATPSSGYAWATPVITGNPATIGQSTTVTVTVANKLWRAALTPGYWKNHKTQALPYLPSIKLGDWPSPSSMTWAQATAVSRR